MANSKQLAIKRREEIKTFYRNKYFSLFLISRKWEGLSEQQNRYLMTQLYHVGTALIFDADVDKLPPENSFNELNNSEDQGGQTLIITPYSATSFNSYNYPTLPTPINVKGIPVIPSKQLENGVNCVIVWGHTSHKSIESLVNFYVEQIADVQTALDMNLYIQRVPKLYTCSPADTKRVQEIASQIDAGVKTLFITTDDWQAITQVIDAGQSYIIDKLYKYKQDLEDEVLTLIGVKSVTYEKEGRITDEEATANLDVTQLMANEITSTMQEGAEQVRDVLGYNLRVIDLCSPEVLDETSEEPVQEDEGGNDNEEDKE